MGSTLRGASVAEDYPPGLLLQTLLEIKEDIGELRSIGTLQAAAFTAHCASDDKMHAEIIEMQLDIAKQAGGKGVVHAITRVATGLLASAAGYFVAKRL
jgi:hypothetical protein